MLRPCESSASPPGATDLRVLSPSAAALCLSSVPSCNLCPCGGLMLEHLGGHRVSLLIPPLTLCL